MTGNGDGVSFGGVLVHCRHGKQAVEYGSSAGVPGSSGGHGCHQTGRCQPLPCASSSTQAIAKCTEVIVGPDLAGTT